MFSTHLVVRRAEERVISEGQAEDFCSTLRRVVRRACARERNQTKVSSNRSSKMFYRCLSGVGEPRDVYIERVWQVGMSGRPRRGSERLIVTSLSLSALAGEKDESRSFIASQASLSPSLVLELAIKLAIREGRGRSSSSSLRRFREE